MSAETDEQLRFLIEDLHAVLHPVDDPDVVVAVDGDTFGTREVSGPVAGFAEGADELSVAIEDLDPVVEGVGDVEIAVVVDRQPRGPGEIAGSGEFMFMSAGANPALQLQSVSVVNQNLILIDIRDVEKPVLGVDRHPAGFHQSIGDDVFGLMLGIENQHVAQARVGDKEAIVIVHGQTDDANKVAVGLVLDEFNFPSLGC